MEIPYMSEPRQDTGLFNAKVGIWLFLASEVMLFGALFSSYILLRVGAAPGDWPHGLLNIWLGMTNTIVLIVSSITVVMAWASLKMKNFGRSKCTRPSRCFAPLIFLVHQVLRIPRQVHPLRSAVEGRHGSVGRPSARNEGRESRCVIHGHFVDKAAAAKVTHAWQEQEIKEEEITQTSGHRIAEWKSGQTHGSKATWRITAPGTTLTRRFISR